jgi:hypothetical protein
MNLNAFYLHDGLPFYLLGQSQREGLGPKFFTNVKMTLSYQIFTVHADDMAPSSNIQTGH